MRDVEVRRLLNDVNPWWRSVSSPDRLAWTHHDRLLRGRRQHDLGYRPDVLTDVATGPVGDSLMLLRGPRRVGKSVLLRDLVVDLCRRQDIDLRQIIHIPCDGFTAADLTRGLAIGRELTRSLPLGRPRIWLLDEVGGIRGWSATLKRARDNTSFGDDTVVVTSSSWQPDENVQGNLLAGRAGTGDHRRLRLLLPMTFRSFLTATRPQLSRPEAVHPADLQDPSAAKSLEALEFDLYEYDFAWQEYLTCGGFPRAVFDQNNLGSVTPGYLEDLAAWLRDDVDPDGPADSLPHLLAGLSDRAISPLNVSAAGRDLGYSRDVFGRRLFRLINAFAVLRCPQRNDQGDEVVGASAKHYLVDPLLAWLPSRLRAGSSEPDLAHLSEQTLAIAMARRVEEEQAGRWVEGDTVGFVRTGSGNEVDLGPISLPTSAGPRHSIPIESKWVEARWRAEARTIETRMGRGLIATKTILDVRHTAWAVPAPLVALLLN